VKYKLQTCLSCFRFETNKNLGAYDTRLVLLFVFQLVDLHISIVPMEHWVERLNYASHKIIGDTFSVGFVR